MRFLVGFCGVLGLNCCIFCKNLWILLWRVEWILRGEAFVYVYWGGCGIYSRVDVFGWDFLLDFWEMMCYAY